MPMVIPIMDHVAVALVHDDLLGEGPVWDDHAGHLSWVDIKRSRMQRWRPGSTIVASVDLPNEVSLAMPSTDGRMVVAQVDHLAVADAGTLSDLCAVDSANPHTRLNDGCCDPQGRLWVGTYSTRGWAEAGVYRLEEDGTATQVVDNLVAANGMAWTPDGSGMYVVDTGRCRIDQYSPDGHSGALRHVRALVSDDGSRGQPDGVALDREGGLWVAMWGGGHLRRYAPDGRLTHQVQVPVTFPTSVAFGGPDLQTLFVTTSRHHLDRPDAEEAAGSLLSLDPDVPGLASPLFDARRL